MTPIDFENGPFRAEDFRSCEATFIQTHLGEEYVRRELARIESLAQWYADKANARFREIVAACPVVYGAVFTEKDSMGHLHYWHSEPGDKDHTHSARLICIKELVPKGKGE